MTFSQERLTIPVSIDPRSDLGSNTMKETYMKNVPRVVVITGAARGIGYGIAECFAAHQDRIVVADLNLAEAQKAAARLKDAAGASDTLGIACDVSDRGSVKAMLDHVNLSGAFHCTQLVAELMIAAGKGGRIVFITSLAENVTGPAQVDYGASKAGMRMTMVGFATALGKHGITCNAVAPGMILTDMTRHYWEQPEPSAAIKTRVPVGRIGTPTDIGHAVVFLASQQAEYISGITLRVDGGHQACCV